MFTVPKNHSSSIINVYETFSLSHTDPAITVHLKYLPLKQTNGVLRQDLEWEGRQGLSILEAMNINYMGIGDSVSCLREN